jgi:hypothetical protein
VEHPLNRILKGETEDLANLASDLESLKASPGWERLVALLEEAATFEEDRATHAVKAALRAAKPIANQEPLYRWMGKADGLRDVAKTVDKVLELWAKVQAQLEREERGA